LNWIIDFNSEKVFIKKIKDIDSSKIAAQLTSIKNMVIAVNGKLLILHSKNKEFKIGSVIKSVNNRFINDENIFEIEDILKENSEDWSKFKIGI
jgi:hypothetical protein